MTIENSWSVLNIQTTIESSERVHSSCVTPTCSSSLHASKTFHGASIGRSSARELWIHIGHTETCGCAWSIRNFIIYYNGPTVITYCLACVHISLGVYTCKAFWGSEIYFLKNPNFQLPLRKQIVTFVPKQWLLYETESRTVTNRVLEWMGVRHGSQTSILRMGLFLYETILSREVQGNAHVTHSWGKLIDHAKSGLELEG